MKRWIAPLAAVAIGVAAVAPTFAQAQQPVTQSGNSTTTTTDQRGGMPGDGNRMGGRGGGFGLLVGCSITSTTDTVATALGMTASELRVALVGGKTVSDLATEKNIEIQVIVDALQAQHQADLDQALSDGLITQEQYDAVIAAQANAPQLNANGKVFEIRVPDHNIANREAVAAEALGMTCAELVKAVQAGQSISEIAADKNVEVQTVIDAVVKAYEDAAAQDVAEGLITQVQADGRLSGLATEVGQWVYSTHQGPGNGMGEGFGGRGDGFGGRGNGGNGDQNGNGMGGPRGGQPGQPGAPTDPATQATATPTS